VSPMGAPPRTDPPYVPLRSGGWPVQRRTPRWLLLIGVAMLAGAVLVGLVHKPSQSQQAADLKTFLADMRTGTESCAGGVSESLTALRGIGSGPGAAARASATVKIARTGADNCQLANSQPLDDLAQYQVNESLARFHLDLVVNDLVLWCDQHATRVQEDVASEAGAHQAATRQQAAAALRRDEAALNAERAKIDKILQHAIEATGSTEHVLPLPG
jgi:hypothetical protein